MQFLSDGDCGENPRKFATTHGRQMSVMLRMVAEDGLCIVEIDTPGAYTIEIGYRYTLVGRDGKGAELATYHITKNSHATTVTIPNGWNERDVDQDIGDEGEAYPLRLDIIRLELEEP
jgi:hypothetical protein